MGWRELLAWLKAMRRQREAVKPKHDSWSVHDPWFDQMHERARQEARAPY
jgi:hypothetical protein